MFEQEIERKIGDFRELNAIIATAKYFKIKENLILTYNQEKNFQVEGITVRAKPVWRWLLESA